MKLWKCEEIEQIMRSPEFEEYSARSRNRRAGARKATETKRAKLQKEVDEKIVQISVKKLDDDDLLYRTIRDKQAWYAYQDDLRERWDYTRDADSADDQTKTRWMVNYIRHNLASYDEVLYEMSGKVGCYEEYHRYREAVFDKISEVYPKLAGECSFL